MADEEVIVDISMKDRITENLKRAQEAAEGLDHRLEHVGDRAARTAEAFGVSFGLYKGIEAVKESTQEYNKLLIAQSQLQAGIESTGGAAGVTKDELVEMAEKFRQGAEFSKVQIEGMEAQILRFPGVTKANFDEAGQAVIDFAQRTGRGLDETATAIGRALQDPAESLNLLRRYGVEFTAQQKEHIKLLQEKGKTAQAQEEILKSIEQSVGGSAAAAAAADPLFKMKQATEELEESVGGLTNRVLKALTPAISELSGWIKTATDWMSAHKKTTEAIGISLLVLAGTIGAVVLAVKAYNLIVNIASIVTKAWEGAQWLLNAALTANPIGIIVVAIGAAVAAVIYCYNHFQKFRAILWATWEVIKTYYSIVGRIFMDLAEIIQGAFTLNPKKIAAGFSDAVDAVKGAATNLAHAAADGWNEGMKDYDKDHPAAAAGPTEQKGAKYKAGAGALGESAATPKMNKVAGPKAVTITQHIGNVVKDIKITAATMEKGAKGAAQQTLAALMSALNDAQIIAEGG